MFSLSVIIIITLSKQVRACLILNRLLVIGSLSPEVLTPRPCDFDPKVVDVVPVSKLADQNVPESRHRRFHTNKGHIKKLVVIVFLHFVPETTSSTAAPGFLLLVLGIVGRHRLELLLIADLVALPSDSRGTVVPGLPGRLADVLDGTGASVVKHVRHFLEGLVGSLGEEEVHMPEHGKTENGEYEVRLPGNTGECGGNEVGEGEVESPVTAGGQGNSLATDSQRVQLWGVGPRDRPPGGSIRRDEQVRRSNDSLGGAPGNRHGFSVGRELARSGGPRVDSEHTSVDRHPQTHKCSTDQQGGTTTPAVQPDQGGDSHEDINNVVNTRRQKITVTEVSHFEDIANVVHCGGGCVSARRCFRRKK